MIVQHFLKWLDTAKVQERANAAGALARAYLDAGFSFEDRCAAEAALTLLLDDPSPKVRMALSEVFSLSQLAPAQIVAALANDQPEVAAMVLVRSPLLQDCDLIDRAASGSGPIQRLIAMRAGVSVSLSAALAEVGAPEAVIELLGNSSASIATISFNRMAERHGSRNDVREALIAHKNLPAETRHRLMVKVSETLKSSPLVVALMGGARAERMAREACQSGAVTLAETTPPQDHGALAEHLRLSGELTTAFVLRIVAHGKADFLAAILAALSRLAPARVADLLANGRDGAVAAMLAKAGLAEITAAPILKALKIWREVATGKRVCGIQEVTWRMLAEIPGIERPQGPPESHQEIAALLRALHLEALRGNARGHALAITAA